MAVKFKIPTVLDWPWWGPVPVLQLPPGHPELEGTYANWDVDKQIIFMDEERPVAEKRWLLLHEMDHAYTDWKLWVEQNMHVKVPDKFTVKDIEETPDDPTQDSQELAN